MYFMEWSDGLQSTACKQLLKANFNFYIKLQWTECKYCVEQNHEEMWYTQASVSSMHTASQTLVSLPQAELEKSPKIKRLLTDFHFEIKTVCPSIFSGLVVIYIKAVKKAIWSSTSFTLKFKYFIAVIYWRTLQPHPMDSPPYSL